MNAQSYKLPANWRWAKVGDVLQSIEAGKSPKTQERPATPGEWGVLKVSAVTWGEFRSQENKALLSDFNPKGIPTVRAGDLLISRANTVELVGAVTMAKEDHPNLILSDKTLRLNPDLDVSDPAYLLHWLRTKDARQHLESHATGTSGSMRNISQENIRSTPIPLPPIAEQRRIAAILDRADAVRRKRQEAIALTEELLRSAFLEMFGDPVRNPIGWQTVEMGDIINGKPNNGIFRKNDEYIGSIPVVWVRELFHGHTIDCSVSRTLNPTEKELRNYGLKKGDILFCRSSLKLEGVGYNNVFDGEDNSALFECHAIRVTPDQSKVNSIFLNYLLRQPGPRNRLIARANTVTMSTIGQDEIRKIVFPLPPKTLQDEFESLLRHVVVTQTKLINSNNDELFKSLLQKAFRGEL